MATTSALTAATPWVQVTTTDEDWDSATGKLLIDLHTSMTLIRVFEEYVLDLAKAGLMHGPAHSSIGQEGGASGSGLVLQAGDFVNGSHRGHHQFLAKALGYVAPDGIDLLGDVSPDVRMVLEKTLAEICGLSRGFCHGRGGSLHLQWREAGAMGTNAIVGGGVPQAVGFAFNAKQAGTDGVSVAYFGDGAINIGSVLESINLAGAWKLPVCFFVENNRYAVATTVEESTAEPRLSARGPGFGVASWHVDGMDPLAVYIAMQAAVDHMRAGNGPTLIEADVYRYFHQSGPFPGSAFGYRSKDEEQQWRERDPIDLVEKHILRRKLLTNEQLKQTRATAQELLVSIGNELFEPIEGGKAGERRIKGAEWPDPKFVDFGIRGDLTEFDGVRTMELEDYKGELVERKFIDVVAETMADCMERDARVIVLGEDVHRLNGGTNGATRGLLDRFPGRILGTPISENAFAGMAGGMAMDGRFRPVVEFMYADFMWVAADQIFNQIAKARHMFGGQGSMPLVIRSKTAMGTGYGSQHSMDPSGVYATAAGLRIVAPSTPWDYIGLMNSALTCEDPVIVIEHVDLYQLTGPVPADDFSFHLPVGKAAVRRPGSALTVITYGAMVAPTLVAVEETGVDAEVIDLRWLDKASLDWDTLEQSIAKTNEVLIVEQGARGTGYGGWLGDEISRQLFDHLDSPVRRVHGGEASPSISKVLERASYAGAEEVALVLREIMGE